MLNVTIDTENLIAILEPSGALSKDDFEAAATKIDPMIEQNGRLNGVIIHTESFPGWDSFSAFCSHMRFVKDHHNKVTHVALVTNSAVGEVGEHIASHFISAEVKKFPFDDLEHAKEWILE
ncbi:MAG: STAS/SEC14 domain-containing protein [Bdellovibrionales bacterium]|nr:STAS/SEC14 domain-containing protein [Bdellovibrionales bacterium]